MPESSWESELTEDRRAIRSPEAKGCGEGVNTAGVFSGSRICETGKERRRGTLIERDGSGAFKSRRENGRNVPRSGFSIDMVEENRYTV